MKTLLIVSGGVEAVPGIQRAKELGLKVVVSDMNPLAPGCEYADDCILADTYNVEQTVDAARKYSSKNRIDGVISVASDVPVTVAGVAAALGLPGISVDVAKISADKLEMKKVFRENDIGIPWFAPVSSHKNLQEIVNERGLPLVVKPVDSRGSRGVLKITKDIDLDWAFNFSSDFSPARRVIVEEYLPGPQLSTESIVWDGQVWTIGVSDRNYEYIDKYSPHIIENGGELPSFLGIDVISQVKELLDKAIKALGVKRGTVKGDIVVTPDGPKVIELAVRLSGGYLCTHEIPLNTGVDFVGTAIKIALGEKPDPDSLVPRYQKGVVQRYFFPPPGRITRIEGAEHVESLEHIKLFKMYLKPGDIVEPIRNHPGRGGVLIAVGKDREEALKRAINAVDTVKIVTEPVHACICDEGLKE